MRWASDAIERAPPVSRGATSSADAECARFFRELIRYLGASRTELALRLGCNAHVLEALERGDIEGLPPWPETVRIVTGLTSPAGIDPRPALQLIGRRWKAAADTPPRRAPRQSAISVLEKARAGFSRVALFKARPPLRAWVYAAAIAAPLAFAVFAARPTAILAAASAPEPFAGLFRGAREFVFYQTTPRKDGLLWIEVDDPRRRRGDKLPAAARKG